MAKTTKSTGKGKTSGSSSSGARKSSGARTTSAKTKSSTARSQGGRSSGATTTAKRPASSAKTNRSTSRVATRVKASSARAQPAARQKELDDLLLETLKDMYNAEKQILRALPKMAKAAQSAELRQAFETHAQETQGQVGRLERVFEMLGKRASSKPCHAIQGLVEEGQEVMKEFKGSDALDAGLLAAAQAVEHYEISRYGTMRAWAEQLGMHDAARLLDDTLGEEKKTDDLLTGLAESAINRKAA